MTSTNTKTGRHRLGGWSAGRALGVRPSVAALALTLALCAGAAGAQTVNFEGAAYVNKGLVGVARVPSNAVDKFGDTLGGFGSGDGARSRQLAQQPRRQL